MAGPNQSTRNYGWGRNMEYAARESLNARYGGGCYGTVAAHTHRFSQFSKWARRQGVRDLALNDAQALLDEYAAHIRHRVDVEELSISYAQNLLSSINITVGAMRGDRRVWISPAQQVGKRSTLRTTSPDSMDWSRVERATELMRAAGLQRAAIVVELARHLGMRAREAILADLPRLVQEAKKSRACNIQEGAKGGRTAPRWVPAVAEAGAVLHRALKLRPFGSSNLLHAEESLRQFIDGELKRARIHLHAAGIKGFHDCRAGYACSRYRQMTGVDAPAVTGHPPVDRQLDSEVREVLAQELGHYRAEVCVSYIGPKRGA
jgi:hypothetical protein